MGNSSTRGPKIDKTTLDKESNFLRVGVCEMQGWRPSMVRINLLPQPNRKTRQFP